MSKIIFLSAQSITDLKDLCRIVERKNPHNEMSVSRAQGISEYMSEHEMVSESQGIWLARNCDFYGIERPSELQHLIIEKKSSSTSVSLQNVPAREIIQSLRTMEKLLADFLQTLPRYMENDNA